MKTEQPVSIRVTHRFAASPERVFDAWLDPGKVSKFLFATATGQIVRVEIDARVGGSFTIVDRRHGEDVAHVGTYLELDRPRRIVFTLTVPKYSQETGTISIDIEPLAEGCELTLTHEMPKQRPEMERSVREGWDGVLDLLSELLPTEAASCGMGLAQHAVVPARIAGLLAALAETLETHRSMLELGDANARKEDAVYAELAASYHEIASTLQATAHKMAGCRDLPAAAHDEKAFGKPQLQAFEGFVKAEHGLLAILRLAAERDEAMLSSMSKPG